MTLSESSLNTSVDGKPTPSPPFTTQEHKVFLYALTQNFRRLPLQLHPQTYAPDFAKIADLVGRRKEDCIAHYAVTCGITDYPSLFPKFFTKPASEKEKKKKKRQKTKCSGGDRNTKDDQEREEEEQGELCYCPPPAAVMTRVVKESASEWERLGKAGREEAVTVTDRNDFPVVEECSYEQLIALFQHRLPPPVHSPSPHQPQTFPNSASQIKPNNLDRATQKDEKINDNDTETEEAAERLLILAADADELDRIKRTQRTSWLRAH